MMLIYIGYIIMLEGRACLQHWQRNQGGGREAVAPPLTAKIKPNDIINQQDLPQIYQDAVKSSLD